jgi:protein TonB
MSNPIIFKDLPATFPEKDRFQAPSLASSALFHVLLVISLVVVPLLFPGTIEQWQLATLLVSPLPPPPSAPPPAMEVMAAVKPAASKIDPVVKTDPDALVSPVVVPKDIAHIIDAPIEAPAGVVGGVVGGMPGGIPGGVLGGILAANARTEMAAPPPPPPPPPPPAPAASTTPAKPIFVGGNIKEPRIVKLVPPTYPPLAVKARVSGLVVLEATLTAEGTVEEIRVISGHPLLINAAIECVKQWVYEPTYLNGIAIPIILTAKVSFHQRNPS